MKVGAISGVAGTMRVMPTSKIQMQLDWAKQQVAKARHSGAESVSFVLQNDELIGRLQNLYGKDNVSVEASKSKKVTVKW